MTIPRSQLQLHLCWRHCPHDEPSCSSHQGELRQGSWSAGFVTGMGGWWLWMVVLVMVNHSQKPWILVDDHCGLVVNGYGLVWMIAVQGWASTIHQKTSSTNHVQPSARASTTSTNIGIPIQKPSTHLHIHHPHSSWFANHPSTFTRPLVSIKTDLSKLPGKGLRWKRFLAAWQLLFQCPGW